MMARSPQMTDPQAVDARVGRPRSSWPILLLVVVAMALAALNPLLWLVASPALIVAGLYAWRRGVDQHTRILGLAALSAGLALLVLMVLAVVLLVPVGFTTSTEVGPSEPVAPGP